MFELNWILIGAILVLIASIISYLFGALGNAIGILTAITVICYMIFKRLKSHSKLNKTKFGV